MKKDAFNSLVFSLAAWAEKDVRAPGLDWETGGSETRKQHEFKQEADKSS